MDVPRDPAGEKDLDACGKTFGGLTELLAASLPTSSEGVDDLGSDLVPAAARRSQLAAKLEERTFWGSGTGSMSAFSNAADTTLNGARAWQPSAHTAATTGRAIFRVSRWSRDLDALLDAQGLSGSYTIWIDTSCTISASRTTGPGVYYRFMPGGKISGPGTVTLTIESPANVIAATSQQVFETGVAVRFAASGTVYPQWWGAAGDGSTDDTAAIQAAIDAIGNGTVSLSRGTYIVDGLTADGGTVLKGEDGTALKLRNQASAGILSITGQGNICVESLTFDMNGANQGDPAVPITKRGIHATSVNHMQITDCWFINLFECGIDVYRGTDISIENCYFSGKVEGNPTEWAVRDIRAASCSHITVRGCAFDHEAPVDMDHGIVGIYLSAVSQSTIDDNLLRYCGADAGGQHQGAAIDLYNNNRDVGITNNTLEECNYMGCRISRSSDIRFEGNSVSIADGGYLCTVLISGDAVLGANRIWIAGNTLKTAANDGEGVLIVGNDAAGDEPNEIYVLNNAMEGWYGIRAIRGCHGLLVSGNSIATGYCGMQLEKGASAVLRGVAVSNNYLDMSRNLKQYALGVNGEDIEVYDNTIVSAYRGLSLRIPSGGRVHDNTIEARSYHILLYNECRNLFLDDNQLIGTGSKYYKQGEELVFYDSQ